MKKLFLFITFITLNLAIAEDKKAATDHQAPHPKSKTKTEEMKMKMDMGKGMMDSTQMSEMMGQCMEKNKDNKMCNHEMMAQCQEKMGKKECAEMMKKMKQ